MMALNLKFPCLELVLKKQWGSHNKNYRQQIRQSIAKKLNNSAIKNISQLPQSDEFSISISHSSCFGGYAISPHPWNIGLDIENKNRITSTVIKRIADKEEIYKSPHFWVLWLAKESAYKAFRSNIVLSQIKISQWKYLKSQMWKFKASINNFKNTNNRTHVTKYGYGLIEDLGNKFAIAIFFHVVQK